MKRFIPVVVLGLVLGALSGALSGLFLRALYAGIDFIWYVIPESAGFSGLALDLYPLALGLLGGLLVGLCHKFLGDHPKLLEQTLAEFRETKRVPYKYLPQGVVTAGVSLLFGASLGPEAALLGLSGGLGTWTSDQLRRAGRGLGLVAADEGKDGWSRLQGGVLLTATAAAGLAAMALVVRSLFSTGLLDSTAYEAQWLDLLYSSLPAIVGAVAGFVFLQFQQISTLLTRGLSGKPIRRSLLGGLVLGILAMVFPLVRFSGQHEMQLLRDGYVQMGAGGILLLGLSKLFLTAFLLRTGWKGGQFLPIMFSSAAMGLAVALLFPNIPPAVAMVAAMAAATTIVIGRPIGVLAIMLFMFPLKLLGASASAILVALVLTRLVTAVGAAARSKQTSPGTA